MTKYLWISHSSGGNLAPSLGIATTLKARGHDVAMLVKPDRTSRVVEEGLRAISQTRAYEQVAAYPDMGPVTKVACSITSNAVEAEIAEVVAVENPDILIVDAMHHAGLQVSIGSNLPTAVVCHTFLWRQIDEWQGMFDKLHGMRAGAGQSPLPTMIDCWKSPDRMIITSVAALDDDPLPGWPHVRHVGPSLVSEAHATPLDLPWDDDDKTPIVMVSYTTTELAAAEKVQTALDALADLPVHVVATCGTTVNPDDLNVPENAHVTQYADHDALLQRSTLALTHGGHGTMMRALKHGVPMVMVPGFPHDQTPNATLMETKGAAVKLAPDADAAAIRAAVETVLDSPSYAEAARHLQSLVSPLDGATGAADALEDLAAENHAQSAMAG